MESARHAKEEGLVQSSSPIKLTKRVNYHLTFSLQIPLKNLGFGEVGN